MRGTAWCEPPTPCGAQCVQGLPGAHRRPPDTHTGDSVFLKLYHSKISSPTSKVHIYNLNVKMYFFPNPSHPPKFSATPSENFGFFLKQKNNKSLSGHFLGNKCEAVPFLRHLRQVAAAGGRQLRLPVVSVAQGGSVLLSCGVCGCESQRGTVFLVRFTEGALSLVVTVHALLTRKDTSDQLHAEFTTECGSTCVRHGPAPLRGCWRRKEAAAPVPLSCGTPACPGGAHSQLPQGREPGP